MHAAMIDSPYRMTRTRILQRCRAAEMQVANLAVGRSNLHASVWHGVFTLRSVVSNRVRSRVWGFFA